MVGILIFFIVVLIYYAYSNNVIVNNEEVLNENMLEAKSIVSSLVSAGYPSDWNVTTVERIGLTDGNHRINQTKLDMFANNMTYEDIRAFFRTSYDFYFYLEYINGTKIPLDGNNSIGIEASDHDNLVSMRRIVIYDSQMVNMALELWH